MADDDQTDEQQPEDETSTEQQPHDWQKEAEKWREHSRKQEKLAKSNADAAKRLAQLEDASKSEQQRAADAQKAAEQRAAKAEAELLRVRIAAEHDLSPADARRLIGDTEDELRADAAAYADERKPSKATGATRRPTEQLRGGAEPDEQPEELDPEKLAAAIAAAR
jgi:hypothetical protein